MWFNSALKRLSQGEFVCKVRYPDEFEALDSPQGRERAGAWLGEIGYRLCQLEDDGAYFMAYATLDQDAKAAVRDALARMRDLLQPTVRYLETVRQALGRDEQLQPGHEVALSALIEAVRASSSLDRRLDQMRDIYNSRTGEASTDRLARILDLLEKEGYLHLANPSHKVYLVTGKIKYMYQLLAVMAEHTPQMNEVQEQGGGEQAELAAGAAASTSAAQEGGAA